MLEFNIIFTKHDKEKMNRNVYPPLQRLKKLINFENNFRIPTMLLNKLNI